MKRGIVLYLHVHQPFRVRPYSVFDTAVHHDYFDSSNEQIFHKVANKSYRPMNALLLELLQKYPDFRVSFSITGTFIEQAQKWAPDVLESFQKIAETGQAEIITETYYHSLAFFYSRDEFEAQVAEHRKVVKELFDQTPKVFRNTEFAYNNQLAEWADKAGYTGILAEGWDPILGWRSPNYVYQPIGTENIKLLLKNYRLSDDIAFRFAKSSHEIPLTADTYAHWLNHAVDNAQVVNLFMDYETFGEHQWADSGIFEFMRYLPEKWLEREDNTFYTPSEAIEAHESKDIIDMPSTITWADSERDLTAWLGNSMQQEAMRHLYELEEDVLRSGDDGLIEDWRKLQTSDHPYYMCTKWFNDGDVHAYFSPYDSPYDAFLYFMNAVRDVRYRVMQHQKGVL